MGPLDYSGAFAAQDPSAALMDGIKNGVAIRGIQDQRALAEQAKLRDAAMRADLAELSANPTAAKIGQYSLKYPQLSEQFKRSYDMLAPEEKAAKLNEATQIFTAFSKNKPDVGLRLMREKAQALRNAGDERGAGATEAMAKVFEMDPGFATFNTGTMVNAMAGPEKFAAAFKEMGEATRAEDQAPAVLRKGNADADAAEADASTKKVGAKFAEQGALLELEKKGWDIKKIKEDIDIAKQSNRIAAMNAAVAREGNSLKRQELQIKIDDALSERDSKVREKVSKAESGVAAMDNMLNTVERVLKNPGLNDVLGSLEGASYYPNIAAGSVTALNPLTSSSDDRADAIALIDTLGSQAFLSQVPTVQGMGSLSNAEGEKLQSALQNLSRRQSEKQFRTNMEEVRRIVGKARTNVGKRYGAPVGNPDTPAVRNSRPPLESFEGGGQ